MKFHTCKNCGEVLTSQLERRGGQLMLPCWECGAENIVQPFLEVVGLSVEHSTAQPRTATTTYDTKNLAV